MQARVYVGFLATTVLISAAEAAEPTAISLGTLLSEMTDLKAMAEFPAPAYTCRQFSSYDRKSVNPNDADTWFANDDANQFIRVEDRDGRKEHVMMDAAGPGAIVRIWSANPEGVVRVYLDDAAVPAIEVELKALLGGKADGFPSPIACEVSRGWNSYLPIPYARHCKVTSDKPGFYYHVNYRTYEAGTPVVSFSREQLKKLASRVDELAAQLRTPRGAARLPEDARKTPFQVSVEPGQSLVLVEQSGPGAICRFTASLKAGDITQALRHVLVRMIFDGVQTVEAPIGDFFGTAPGVNAYESLPLGMTKEGEMWCHWHMPYEKSVKIELMNMGEQAAAVGGEVCTVGGPACWTPRSMHFHARWRSELQTPSRPMRDWNYLTARGKGVFAGVAFNINNPVKDWWGEGDEKIYVDGEAFPSHFGTGTEDYFGYAWCSNRPFVHAYHNQARCDGPGNFGQTSVNRWHIIDRIPFAKDFRFDMELWHWNATCKVDMAVIAYWYAAPGGTSGFKPIRKGDLKVNMLPPWKPPKVAGAIEGEFMRVISKAGVAEPQDVDPASEGKHLWWCEGKPGDKLVLALPAKEAGPAQVRARFVKAPDYGIIQVSINNKKAGEPIDLYHGGVTVSDVIDLGAFDLREGENELTIEIVGKNPKAINRYMVGLDFLMLERAK